MESKDEIWKDVPGYEGYYQVSNLGRVRSLDRTYFKKVNIKGKIIKQGKDRYGYPCIWLTKNGKRKWKNTHRVLAETFIDDISENVQVNHIDGHKCNNNIENLELCTAKENIEHYYNVLGSVIRKISIKDILEIKRIYNSGIPKKDIASAYNITRQTLYRAYKKDM